jgi:hypothetical protein
VLRIVENLPTTPVKAEEAGEEPEIVPTPQLTEGDIEAITTCVEEITRVYALAPSLIVSMILLTV